MSDCQHCKWAEMLDMPQPRVQPTGFWAKLFWCEHDELHEADVRFATHYIRCVRYPQPTLQRKQYRCGEWKQP